MRKTESLGPGPEAAVTLTGPPAWTTGGEGAQLQTKLMAARVGWGSREALVTDMDHINSHLQWRLSELSACFLACSCHCCFSTSDFSPELRELRCEEKVQTLTSGGAVSCRDQSEHTRQLPTVINTESSSAGCTSSCYNYRDVAS